MNPFAKHAKKLEEAGVKPILPKGANIMIQDGISEEHVKELMFFGFKVGLIAGGILIGMSCLAIGAYVYVKMSPKIVVAGLVESSGADLTNVSPAEIVARNAIPSSVATDLQKILEPKIQKSYFENFKFLFSDNTVPTVDRGRVETLRQFILMIKNQPDSEAALQEMLDGGRLLLDPKFKKLFSLLKKLSPAQLAKIETFDEDQFIGTMQMNYLAPSDLALVKYLNDHPPTGSGEVTDGVRWLAQNLITGDAPLSKVAAAAKLHLPLLVRAINALPDNCSFENQQNCFEREEKNAKSN